MTKHIVTARLDSRRSRFHIIDECLAFDDYNEAISKAESFMQEIRDSMDPPYSDYSIELRVAKDVSVTDDEGADLPLAAYDPNESSLPHKHWYRFDFDDHEPNITHEILLGYLFDYLHDCGEIGDDLSVIAWQKQPAREDV